MRDVERVKAVLDRFQCGAVFALMKPTFEVMPLLNQGVTVVCETRVPDRDTNELVRVVHQTALPGHMTHAEEIQSYLYWWLSKIWENEFDEAVKFDGKLVRDPHA